MTLIMMEEDNLEVIYRDFGTIQSWARLLTRFALANIIKIPVVINKEWSDDFDSDYENPDEPSNSETYVVPGEETADDSYEPPLTEKEKRKLPTALPFSKGEYADNRSHQRHSPPFSKTLPDKVDYVVPVEDEDENYIHPTESNSPSSEYAPKVNRSVKLSSSASPNPLSRVLALAPEMYEIPVSETSSFPPY
ncbi:B-cell linker protein-like [Monodelphis domestica]|uniref:B-cell linker protein-like n=1 Tax=Monodelphis domestica TaxID=13616 RepID=UPI0024E21DA8|nr:B-cell linker protein-like [Monodelphis domestica]